MKCLLKNFTDQGLKKVKIRNFYDRFTDNIWAADLAEMVSLYSRNRGAIYLLFLLDVFTKYEFVKPLKDKNAKTVLNGFIRILNECKRKSNKIFVHQGKEIHNSLM